MYVDHNQLLLNFDDSSDDDSDTSEHSFGGPPCSPVDITGELSTEESTSHQLLVENHDSAEGAIMQDNVSNAEVATVGEQANQEIFDDRNGSSADVHVGQQDLSTWSGFKIVGNNIAKNFRPSFQWHNNKTNFSTHVLHFIAVQDHVDFSKCSETTASGRSY